MTGRPTKWSEEMEDKAKEYIVNYAEHGHPLPSVVGMAVILGVNKTTLYQWVEDERGSFSNTLAMCSDHQELELLNKGLIGDFNPTIVKLALANHGYHDKADNTISAPGGGPVEVMEFTPVGADHES